MLTIGEALERILGQTSERLKDTVDTLKCGSAAEPVKAVGVTFLIAVVSIVGGMGRYMKDDLVGKIIARAEADLALFTRDGPDVAALAPALARFGLERIAIL